MSFGFPQPRIMEIPVQHESSRFQQRSSTPPRSSSPPKSDSPTFYTLPRNHRVTPQQERVREIPIQHFSSRSMSPSRVGQGHSEPHPDYPGSRGSTPTSQSHMSQGPPQPQSSYPQYQQPPECPQGQGYPQKHQYPQQVYPPQPQQYPPQQYPQKEQQQGYPQPPLVYPPQPQQQRYPQPNYQSQQQAYPPAQQGYPQQQTYPQQPNSFQERQRFPTPEECPPPQHQQVVHSIPIIRDDANEQAKEGFGTWPRQPKQTRASAFPSEAESQQKMEPVSKLGSQKYRDQNQNANDEPDAGKPAVEKVSKTDNGVKTEPPKPQMPKTPIELIADIANGCKELEDRVMNFKGTKADKEYKFLEEMLTRSILKLDGIESGADDNIRQARKRAVREIQSFLDQLELKAFSQETGVQKMETDSSSNGSKSMDTSQVTRQGNNSSTRTESNNDAKVKEMVLDSEIAC